MLKGSIFFFFLGAPEFMCAAAAVNVTIQVSVKEFKSLLVIHEPFVCLLPLIRNHSSKKGTEYFERYF